MSFDLLQFSLVVAAKSHNPTILNPDFLRVRDIVPNDWEVAGTAITTPPLAMVRFTNGIFVQFDPDRMQVGDRQPDSSNPTTRILPLATKLIETLPQVQYTGVGSNFQAVVEVDEGDTFLKSRFLAAGPWNNDAHPLAALGLRLVYPLEPSGTVTLSLDGGEAQRTDGTTLQAVIANANFNRGCTEYPADTQVKAHLGCAEQDWTSFKTLLTDILNDGGS